MGDAIGQMLPAAVGVAVSPLPIVAVVLMLVSRRGRVNGPVFVAGWLAGLAVIGAIVLSVSSGAGASDEGQPETWVGAYALFMLVATIGVGAPVVIGFVMGDRSRALLDDIKTWMASNNAVIMAVLLLILGVKLLGDGVSAL
jgi:Sap, sulfolipid-1-addressing protein